MSEDKKRLRAVITLFVAITGGALFAYGAWLAFPPAGFISAGSLLLALGISEARS